MRVDVVFADGSLGGTSRSALTMGRAWTAAGHDVRFRPQIPPHPDRGAEFAAVGELLAVGDDAPLAEFVHLHHGAWSREHHDRAASLVERARRAPAPPRLLTHNIFGTADRVLDPWPGGRTVGVLGAWVGEQYRWAMAASPGSPRPVVVPNPQDDTWLTPPTEAERRAARAEWGIRDGERLALRIGSPHPDKWSRAYVETLRRNPHMRFLLIGAPADLIRAVEDLPHVTTSGVLGDDRAVRGAYAAADVFVHAADRGESFGNVLIESLLTGLPVVSLARPYRDNTPWEFRTLPGFTYATGVRAWQHAVAGARGRGHVNVDRDAAAARYGIAAVSARLADIARGGAVEQIERPGAVDRLRVGALHNPLVSAAKALRLRGRSR